MESVVSFWDCVKRKKAGLPAIIKNPSEAWDKLITLGEYDESEEIVKYLPPTDSKFIMSLQRNEMVILGMSDDEWNDAVSTGDIRTVNKYLYRVWKLTTGQYCFKYHTNTTASIEEGDKEIKQFYIIGSIPALMALHPRKLTVSLLGKFNLQVDD